MHLNSSKLHYQFRPSWTFPSLMVPMICETHWHLRKGPEVDIASLIISLAPATGKSIACDSLPKTSFDHAHFSPDTLSLQIPESLWFVQDKHQRQVFSY